VKLIKEKRITRMGIEQLCRMFGKSRQAYYQKEIHLSETGQMEEIVLELVAQIR
jgi:hypothetical protein